MSLSRRGFLGAAAGSVAAGAVLVGCESEATSTAGDKTGAAKPQSFYGKHQMGILPGPAEYAAALCLDVTAPDRAGLVKVLQSLSEQISALVTKAAPDPTKPRATPEDNSILASDKTDRLVSGTVAAGASLFDSRFGLAAMKPASLVPMPDGLARDELDPAQTHGDLLVILQGAHRDIVVHAVRRVMRAVGGSAKLRWMVDVFLRPDTTREPDTTSTRNLLGFKDGTANPDTALNDLMSDVVWSAGAADGEPAWCAGGSYLVARTLRMTVEAWDAETLEHQEKVFGRAKVSGAPLDGKKETDVPVYPKDPAGQKIPFTAHIRLANPRDGKAKLMLRRSMNYSRGVAADGTLDQGLFFVSYQRTMGAFLEAQERLKGEPLEQFVITHGGGFFFAFPGPSEGQYVGQTMIDAAG